METEKPARLRPGELRALVLAVVAIRPGVAWTVCEVASLLPGRSLGAVSNALSRLTAAGVVQVGEHPKLYEFRPSVADVAGDDGVTRPKEEQ